MSLLLLLMAAAALGRTLGRLLPLEQGAEGWIFRMLLGLAGCGALTLAAGAHSMLAAQGALFTVVALGALAEAAARVYDRPARRRSRLEKPNRPVTDAAPVEIAPPARRRGPLETTCLILAFLALALAFLASWAPVSAPEATAGPLALAKAWAAQGSLRPTPLQAHSELPGLVRPLYGLVWAGSGERPAALLSWTMSLMAVLAAWALGRRIAGPAAGAGAAALFACAPVFFGQAATVTLVPAQTAFAFASMTALLAGVSGARAGCFALAGLMSGAAVGSGLAALPLPVLLALAALFHLPDTENPDAFSPGPSERLGRALLLLVCAALLPGALLALARFHGGAWPPLSLAPDPAYAVSGFHWASFARFPWDLVMRPAAHGGWARSAGGMLFALGVPAFLFGGHRARVALTAALLGGLPLYFFHRSTLAALPWCALAIGAAAAAPVRMPAFRRTLAVLLAAGCLFGLGLHALRFQPHWPVLAGRMTREAWLEMRVPRFAAVRAVNARLPEMSGRRALVLDRSAALHDVPPLANPEALARAAALPGGERVQWLRENQVGLLVVPDDYLGEDSPLPEAVREMVRAWTGNTALCRMLEKVETPRLAGTGIEVTRIYRLETVQ